MQKLTSQNQKTTNNNKRDYISFSEYKKWASCPYARKLAYDDGLKLFHGNSYTAFGGAMHETIEHIYSQEDPKSVIRPEQLFKTLLEEALSEPIDRIFSIETDMPTQGARILENFTSEFESYFGTSYEIFSIEEELYEKTDMGLKYKGFIDMVVLDSEGFYNIIDWKTCSWGWDAKKKSDPLFVYQLSFYKSFFCNKHGIDPDRVKTHFGLLKRTAKRDNVEIFLVTNGKIRVRNAMDSLAKAAHNIQNGPAIKNRLSCRRCEYHGTEHCP